MYVYCMSIAFKLQMEISSVIFQTLDKRRNNFHTFVYSHGTRLKV